MKRRYSIWGREHCSDHDVEIIQVETNPEAMRKALGLMTLTSSSSAFKGGKRTKIKKYTWLRIVENK
jgi:hypothetical protein